MKWKRALSVLGFGCLFPLIAAAQGVQYGSIAGVVTDSESAPVAGVMITVSGGNLQGTRDTVSDEQGRFRLTILPAGQYSLTFQLSRFQTQNVTDLVVNIGRTTEIEVQMRPTEFEGTIEVSGERIVIDTTKSTIDTSVDWDLADTLPTNRSFVELMEIAPTVEPGFYAPLVGGQSNTADLFLVDGVDTTDPKVQIWGTVINWDTIAEAQLQTAAFSAEYGRAPGAVLNLVTKSGGNEFHGSVRWVEAREDWSASPGIDDETGNEKVGGGQVEESRPSVTFGGPILKDSLWFFLSYERRDQISSYSRYASIDDVLTGTLTEGKATFEGHYASAKLTWQATPNHRLVGFYNEDPTTQWPLQGGWYGAIYHEDTERSQDLGGDNFSLQWTGVLSPDFFMEANYQNHGNAVNVIPTSRTWNSVPYTYDLAWGYAFGGPSIDYRSVRDRDGVLVSGTYFKALQSSSHEFKAGVEYLDIKPELSNVWNDAGQYWTWLGSPYIRFLYLDQSGFNTTQQDYWAVYVQDQWTIGNLTLNLGVRSESTTIHNNQGTEIVKFGFDEQIAPRLGFAYDLNGDSIHGSISRFYFLATNYIGDYFSETTDHVQQWNWNYACDPAAAEYYEHPDSCWTLAYDIPRWGGSTTVDPNLKPAHLDEFTLGYNKRISNQMALGVDFVWRWQDSQIDWYDPDFTGYNEITNVPKEEDVGSLKWSEYQALSLFLNKRFGMDGFQFLASYTYAFKNDAWGVTWRDIGQFTFSNPELVDPLRYGRTHSPQRFKFNGSYTMPWHTVVGLGAYWYSGNLYTATTAGVYGSVFIEQRGSSKVGSNWEADLYVEQPFTIGPVRAGVYANVFNMFNNQQVTERVSNSDLATFRDPIAWQDPRRFELGLKIEF